MSRPSYTNRNKTYRRQLIYGITAEQQEALFSMHDGMCHLCKERKAQHIDHDHNTGQIRGALCPQCNSGLGMFGDTIEGLQRALNYLAGVSPHSYKV